MGAKSGTLLQSWSDLLSPLLRLRPDLVGRVGGDIYRVSYQEGQLDWYASLISLNIDRRY